MSKLTGPTIGERSSLNSFLLHISF
jgi:hypothetical protein